MLETGDISGPSKRFLSARRGGPKRGRSAFPNAHNSPGGPPGIEHPGHVSDRGSSVENTGVSKAEADWTAFLVIASEARQFKAARLDWRDPSRLAMTRTERRPRPRINADRFRSSPGHIKSRQINGLSADDLPTPPGRKACGARHFTRRLNAVCVGSCVCSFDLVAVF